MIEDMKVGGCWTWHVGGCATCGARGVPVATMDYYTNCAGCLRRAADELEEKTKAKEETKMSCRHDLANTTCARCYPEMGKIDPGPEEGDEENLEGPGAVTREEYLRARAVAPCPRPLGEVEREDLRRRIQDVLRDVCGLDVDFVSLRWEGDAAVSVVVSYVDDLNFEKLSRISTTFRTRKINLSCDCGTDSDPCHQRELYIVEPDLLLVLGGKA